MKFFLLLYYNKYFLRSLKFIPQTLFFITALAIIYEQKTNIYNSYSLAIICLFITSSWLSYSFINIEEPIQRGLTILHTNNIFIYYLYKVLYLLIVDIILSTLSVILPFLIGAFEGSISGFGVVFVTICYILAGFLGIAIGLFFDSRLLGQKRFSIIAFLLITCIATFGSRILFGGFFNIGAFLISPIGFLIENLSNIADKNNAFPIVSCIYLSVYSIVLIYFYIVLIKKLPQC